MYRYIYKNELGEEIDFSPFGEIVALKVDGVSGHEVDVIASKGTNQVGDTVTNTIVSSKNITIDGVIKDNTERNRKKLLKVIKPQIKGELLLITENNEVFKLDVITKISPIIGFGSNYQLFQISFYSSFPYWKKDVESRIDINGISPLFKFPRNFSGTWKISELVRSEFINVVNDGNEIAPMKIIFKARTMATNPKLENVETGEYIKLNYTLEPNEEIIITTGYNNKRITSSANGNIFKYLDVLNSTFMQLNVGDNIFKFSADENRDNVDVTIYFETVVNSL